LPTPALAFLAMKHQAAAVVITGSHIPFDRNGMKFYRPDGEISKADELAMLAADVVKPNIAAIMPLPDPDASGTRGFVSRYLDFWPTNVLQGMTVAVYEHSSVAREVLRSVLEGLGAKVLSLGRTDTFVPIDTEAVRQEDIVQAVQWAKEHHFDAIVSTDGDGDRPLIGDEQGRWLRGDVVGILCAQALLADAVATPVSSTTAIEKCGLFEEVSRTRIGSPYVIEAMQQLADASPSKVVVGFEANGGFLLGSHLQRSASTLAALPTRDAVLPIVAVLAAAKFRACPVSSLTQSLPVRFTASDRIQEQPTDQSLAMIQRLKTEPHLLQSLVAYVAMNAQRELGGASALNEVDGARWTFANGDIIHLRPSGNAPELRCYAEADTEVCAFNLCLHTLAWFRQNIRAT
jgi:phosphomannomutase